MDDLNSDLRIALRSLARRPGFTVVAVLTMSLGVGASTAMFSVLNGVVLQPLPYSQPERIVALYLSESGSNRPPWSGANFVDFQAQASSYEAVAGCRIIDYSVLEDEVPWRLVGVSVTADFFRVFGVPPALGRVFGSAADGPGGERAVVVSHGFWVSRLGSDPAAVGRALELNGESYAVVGVMPAGFAWPSGTQLWTASPYRAPEGSRDPGTDPAQDRDDRYFHVVARLREGVSPAQARGEGEAIAARLAEVDPEDNRGLELLVAPLHEEVVGSVRPALLALFGAVGLVMLIACANVANLLLARATGRAHEVAVRAALGAGRWRLARQLLTESLLLGLAGGAGGALVALGGTETLISFAASELPRAAEVEMSLPVLGFALAAALVSGLLFGIVPTLWLTRENPDAALRSGGARVADGTSHGRLRGALVAVEIGLSLTLLVGLALLVRTLILLSAVDPGFSARTAVTAQIWLPGSRQIDDDALRAYQSAVLERARALPGVTSAGAVLSLPVDWGVRAVGGYSIEGREYEAGAEPVAGLQAASPGYFEAMGIPVLRGRSFSDEDGPDSPPVMVISQAFAESLFPGEEPLGRRIGLGRAEEDDFEWATVVGVVGSTRHDGLDAEPRAEVYQPLAQAPWPYMTLVLRTSLDAGALAEPLRRAVLEVSTDQPVARIVTLEQILHESLARRRFGMVLLGLFAGLALLLAAVGLYGVMSFSVAQRSREIGIRMALGAHSRDIVRMVLGAGARLLGVGLAIGAAGSLVVGRFLQGFLFQVPPTDPAAFATAALVLCSAALVASWLPARRAGRTDPIGSLRADQ